MIPHTHEYAGNHRARIKPHPSIDTFTVMRSNDTYGVDW